MAIRINTIYLAGFLIPKEINDPSPSKSVLPSSAASNPRIVDIPSATNPVRVHRHFCIIVQYDPASRIGVMLLGTSRPRQGHRFVPVEGTPRLPFQPQHEVQLIPRAGLSSTGYFNFTHALRATIITRNDPVVSTVPPQAFITDSYANGPLINVLVSGEQVEALKTLHTLYWQGVQYTEDGRRVEAVVGWGEGGGAGSGGRSGGILGGGTLTGGEGERSALGGSFGGVSGGGPAPDGAADGLTPVNPDGTCHKRPLNADGTVTIEELPTAEEGSGSERLARALKEEEERWERFEQLDLLGVELLELEMDPPTAVAFVEPLTSWALGLVDAF